MSLQKQYASLSDNKLKHKTFEFKQRLNAGISLQKILPEAFAVVCEADKRVLGMMPYGVQILGGIVLHEGNLAEMKTGEGKTLTETMPVYLNALTDNGVHVVTVNDYLCQRDAKQMGKVFKFLGLTVACNSKHLDLEEKKKAYSADILYSTNDELAFDYLRDNMIFTPDAHVQRKLNYAIVDEVDSILIDEAKTPLIISEESKNHLGIYKSVDKFVKKLRLTDYQIDLESKTISLTSRGINKAELYFGVEKLFDEDNLILAHFISDALKANYIMSKDVDYIVKNGDVLLVDSFTGRVMPTRRFADGLHQAIEAKENLEIHPSSKTDASITYQNYFRMYHKLAGMTGTAKNEAKEFYQNYHMKVVTIPTNKPSVRVDYPDALFATKKDKMNAIIQLVKKIHETGQPILLGTTSVEDSDKLHHLLLQEGLSHTVLNAKNNSAEAKIIAKAGLKNSITVATNMAGRGTDIKLGNGVKQLGGLFVIGTEKHSSRRIDDQLRGRSGRQGEPGSTRFFVSLEDNLMKRYATDSMKLKHDELIVKGQTSSSIKSSVAQKWITTVQLRVEGSNYDMRRNTLQFDDVMRKERDVVYQQRSNILYCKKSLHNYVAATFAKSINHNVNLYFRKKSSSQLNHLCVYLQTILGVIPNRYILEHVKESKLKKILFNYAIVQLKKKEQELSSNHQINEFERVLMLKAMDEGWKENINDMEQLRLSILFQGYGQHNPLVEYQRNAQKLYQQMANSVEDKIVKSILFAEIKTETKKA